MSGDDYFDRWQEDGDNAFRILQDGLEVPPSLEVFEFGLERVRRRRGVVTIQQYAAALVAGHEKELQ